MAKKKAETAHPVPNDEVPIDLASITDASVPEAIEDIKSNIEDLLSVEPKSIADEKQAADAAAWLESQKLMDHAIEDNLGIYIQEYHRKHKLLTGIRKEVIDRLEKVRNRVRYAMANWIAAGHKVEGMYTKTTYTVTVDDVKQLPAEYLMVVANMTALEAWAKLTEGKQPVPGATFEPKHTLYQGKAE